MTRIICGVDVACRTLAARIGRDGCEAEFSNHPEGIAALAAFCRTHHAELVAMEATGGYEQQSFTLLGGHGLAVAILNPRQVRRFAEGMGVMEKTDRIDAGLIAWFAEVKRCKPSPPPAPDQQHSAFRSRWEHCPRQHHSDCGESRGDAAGAERRCRGFSDFGDPHQSQRHYGKVLVVTGSDADQTVAAAQALALGFKGIQGPTVPISDFRLPAKSRPDDAPRWALQDTHGFFTAFHHAWWKLRSDDDQSSGELGIVGLPDALIEEVESSGGINQLQPAFRPGAQP